MTTMLVRRLDAAHDMTFGAGRRNLAATGEATGQRLRCRFLTILGEWFLDTSKGVPWWQPEGNGVQPIMGGSKNLQYTEAVLKSIAIQTDGVATLDSFSMSFNGNARKLTIAASGTTVDGDAFNITVTGP